VIGLIAAMRQEVSGLAGSIEDPREQRSGNTRIIMGRVAGSEVALAWGGVGPDRAAEVAGALAGDKRVHALISVGYAGAAHSSLRIGTLVIAEGAWRAAGMSREESEWLPCDPGISRRLDLAAGRLGIEHRVGPFATVDRLISLAAEKKMIHEALGAIAVEMESAAVGRAARDAGLPWGAVRAISDDAVGDLPNEAFLRQWRKRGSIARGIGMTLRDPVSMIRLVGLLLGARKARGPLSLILEALVGESLFPNKDGIDEDKQIA